MPIKLFLHAVLYSAIIQSYTVMAAERNPDTIFNDFCFACHGTGWEDAPVIGDSFAWEDRIGKGLDTLLKNTLEGVNAMPPKGACDDCSKDELLAVIKYMTED